VERTRARLSGEAIPGSFSPQRGGGPWLDFRAISASLQQSETVCQQFVYKIGRSGSMATD
jgi:hypothetical protein